MNEGLYQKGQVLFRQGRYDDAEKIFGELLAVSPDDDHLLYLLAEISFMKNKFTRSEDLVNSAIARYPQESSYFFLKSRIAVMRDNFKEAERHINTAIKIEPHKASLFAFYAIIKLSDKDYEKALELADKALAIDPSNLNALNTRSTSLLKLKREDESFETIKEALYEDPDNAYTHTNFGWNLLQKGENKRALQHFSEALRKDPNSSYAQSGMMEALKARFILYRWFLNYAFWMGDKASKYQWFIILGFYFGTTLLNKLATNNESLKPLLTPVIFLLTLLAFSTWVIEPISNVFLRFNRYGRHLLSKQQQTSSLLVSLSLLLCLVSIVLWLCNISEVWFFVAIFGFTMMVPLSKIFNTPRSVFMSYAIAMGCLGIVSLSLAYTQFFGTLSTVYLVAFIAYQFIANYYITRTIL